MGRRFNSLKLTLTSNGSNNYAGFAVDRIEYVLPESTQNIFNIVDPSMATDRAKTIVVSASYIPESSYWAYFTYANNEPKIVVNTAKMTQMPYNLRF